MVKVITSSAFANVVVALLDAMATPLNVGAVLSNVTEPFPVVTAVPSLPARSENAILKVTRPSVSPDAAV